MSESILPFGFSVALTYIFTRALIPVAPKLGLLDIPCSRKKHSGEIPLVGGLAIYGSILICTMLFANLQVELLSIITIGGLLTTVGTLDDKYGLSANLRLCIQFLAGILLAIGAGIELNYLGDLFGLGDIHAGWLAIPFTAIGIAALSNAYNMTDGIDGLASSLGIVAFSFLLISLYDVLNRSELLILSFYILSLAIYLIFNFALKPLTPSKVFMGDAGSMFIGFSIAAFMIYFTQNERFGLEPAVVLWFVAVPLYDMIATMIRRLRKGQSPFYPDRTHLHHILMHLGMSAKISLFSIIVLSISIGCIGYLLLKLSIPTHISFGLFSLLFATYAICILHAWRLKKVFQSASQ